MLDIDTLLNIWHLSALSKSLWRHYEASHTHNPASLVSWVLLHFRYDRFRFIKLSIDQWYCELLLYTYCLWLSRNSFSLSRWSGSKSVQGFSLLFVYICIVSTLRSFHERKLLEASQNMDFQRHMSWNFCTTDLKFEVIGIIHRFSRYNLYNKKKSSEQFCLWTNLQNFPIPVIKALYIDVSLYLTLTIQASSRLKRSANHLWNNSDVCRKKFGEWSPLLLVEMLLITVWLYFQNVLYYSKWAKFQRYDSKNKLSYISMRWW